VRNIRLVIEYDGTAFHGWQRQKKAVSVQGSLESVLSRVLRDPVRMVGASRTDAGCHAKAQIANFHTQSDITCEKIKNAVNGLMDGSAVVLDASDVKTSFHARFDATSRTYSYLILNGWSALWRNRAWVLEKRLVQRRMDAAARFLLGEHDFAGFAKRRKELDNTLCTVIRSGWHRWSAGKKFVIEADRFLPGQ